MTGALKYSAGAAKRRLDALHALNEHADLAPAVASGALNLSTISQVQSFVREQRVPRPARRELFTRMAGKSTREVERTLAAIAPEAARPDRQRAIGESQIELTITISRELKSKLDRLRGLLAHRVSSYAELLEVLADVGSKQLDPVREARVKKKPIVTTAAPANAVAPNLADSALNGEAASLPRSARGTASSAPDEASRYISAALRREVWKKARGRCTFPGCSSQYALQVDHIQPYALGGSSSDAANLQLLCRQHNLYRATRISENPSYG